MVRHGRFGFEFPLFQALWRAPDGHRPGSRMLQCGLSGCITFLVTGWLQHIGCYRGSPEAVAGLASPGRLPVQPIRASLGTNVADRVHGDRGGDGVPPCRGPVA